MKRRMYKMYKMYEMYEMYEMYRCMRHTKCAKDMRKYKTDGRYSSQYGFYNGAKSRQLAGDLSLWCGALGSLHWQFNPAEN